MSDVPTAQAGEHAQAEALKFTFYALREYNITFQIKDLRKKIGLTQVEFVKRAGVGLRFLRELEQGKTTVRMDKLTQVLDFLGYHLELKKNEPQFAANRIKTGINSKQ